MNILFTICGRAGSKGFKNKNLKEMNGVPLAYYSLAAISYYAEKHPNDKLQIAVNTDSNLLINLMRSQTFLPVRIVDRKEELAGDLVPKVDVIRDTFLNCSDFHADLVIDLDITSPMRRVEDIENVINVFNEGRYDLVFSVIEARRSPYFNMVEKKEDTFYRKVCTSSFTARQQAPKCFELNASIYAYRTGFLSNEISGTILEYNCGISVMPDYLVLDIDSEEDFIMMQYLSRFYCEQDKGLKTIFEIASKMV